jgi:hypothetical protein
MATDALRFEFCEDRADRLWRFALFKFKATGVLVIRANYKVVLTPAIDHRCSLSFDDGIDSAYLAAYFPGYFK